MPVQSIGVYIKKKIRHAINEKDKSKNKKKDAEEELEIYEPTMVMTQTRGKERDEDEDDRVRESVHCIAHCATETAQLTPHTSNS